MRVMLTVLLAALASGCAYTQPDQPTPVIQTSSPAPATIRATASSRSDYTTAVVATVLTADGHFVAGIPIGFSTVNGTVSTAATTTDANGSATTIVTTPANTTVTVTIGALSTTVQVTGAAAPSTGQPTPPIPAPAPPTITPFAIINAPSTATTGASVSFGVSAPSLGQTWQWNFGDGATASTQLFTTAHTYTKAGPYTVTVSAPGISTGTAAVTVSDPTSGGGGSSTPTLAATVACGANTPPALAAPCNVSSVTYGSTTIPSNSVTASWDWGDGSATSTGVSPAAHTFPNKGTFNVVATVTATTADGTKIVTVPKSITIS